MPSSSPAHSLANPVVQQQTSPKSCNSSSYLIKFPPASLEKGRVDFFCMPLDSAYIFSNSSLVHRTVSHQNSPVSWLAPPPLVSLSQLSRVLHTSFGDTRILKCAFSRPPGAWPVRIAQSWQCAEGLWRRVSTSCLTFLSLTSRFTLCERACSFLVWRGRN